MWGTQEETHAFTIFTSFDYLSSITRKDTRHISQKPPSTYMHNSQRLIIADHITDIYTSTLSLLALIKLIPLNLTVSDINNGRPISKTRMLS